METRHIWWDYQKTVHKKCYGAINFKCSQSTHEEIGIDWKATIECQSKSFVPELFSQEFLASEKNQSIVLVNQIIDKEMAYYQRFGPKNQYPAIVINNQTFRG